MRTPEGPFVLLAACVCLLPCAATATSPEVDRDWLSSVQATIRDSEYEVTWQTKTAVPRLAAAWQAPNRAQGFRTYFVDDGIRVVPRNAAQPSWEWGLSLRGYGRGATTAPISPTRAEPSLNRVDYERGGIGEWYVNDARGLEEGFTLFEPPDGEPVARADPIHLDLELTGTLDPVFSTDGQAIDFRTGAGVNVIHFAELVVSDARGRELPARMEGFARTPGRGARDRGPRARCRLAPRR